MAHAAARSADEIFLTLADDFSAQMAADRCGKVERLKPGYTITEADARVSMLTGRPAAQRTTVSASKTSNLQYQYVLQPKLFAEVQNAQAIVLQYDGLNPQAATACFLSRTPRCADELLRPRGQRRALMSFDVTLRLVTGGAAHCESKKSAARAG
jgi:hypothetical protein